jgi:intracellular multiplication protein IcmP
MSKGGGGGQGGQQDDSMGILWIVGAILVFGSIVAYVFKKQIVTFYFKIKLFEIGLVSFFTHRLDDVRYTLLTVDPTTLPYQEVIKLGDTVGNYLRIPFVLLLTGLAYFVYFKNSTRVFKRTYSMKQLATLEQTNWPQITPVLKLDLVKTNIDQGPWAMAMTPMQFCKRHKLLEEHKAQPREGMTRKEWNRIEVTLRRGHANKIFALQLGSLWQGVEKLPLHVRALFAVFAARNQNDTQAAADLLANISRSSATKLDFTGTEELLKKHVNHKAIQKIINSHAYVLTVMASMLMAAREDGVQASADFLWLKPVDRRMWYMLNTVGRQTPFAEVAGPFAHWIAEREIGRRLIVPMVEEATNALDKVLKELIYIPDEPDTNK